MALSITVKKTWVDTVIHVIGTIVASGNYATGGDTLDLSDIGRTQNSPDYMSIKGVAGYDYNYVEGATKGVCLLKALDAAGTEVPAGAYPAGVTGDTITFYAILRRFE